MLEWTSKFGGVEQMSVAKCSKQIRHQGKVGQKYYHRLWMRNSLLKLEIGNKLKWQKGNFGKDGNVSQTKPKWKEIRLNRERRIR